MRKFVLDELRKDDIERATGYLDGTCERGAIDGIYWLAIPDDLLAQVQREHKDCRPFSAAIEVGKAAVSFEFLIRSRARIRCQCVAFATKAQRDFILAFADRMIEAARIPV